MTSPWPAPNADTGFPDDGSGAHDRPPNYRLRRAIAALVVVAVLVGVSVVVVRRSGNTNRPGSDTTRQWNTMVTQNAANHGISVFDRDGTLITTAGTDLVGLTDIGLDGVVLVGEAGNTATDGVGLLDLATGDVTPLRLHTTLQPGAAGVPFRVGYDAVSKALELLDAQRGDVVNLLRFAHADGPVVLPESVRVDPAGEHVAFTELTQTQTVLVDLATSEEVSVPGLLADLAFDSMVTVTNRGDTVLLDLYDLTGARVGTVETPVPAAIMLVDATTALTVSKSGVIALVNFAKSSMSEVGNVVSTASTEASTEPSTGASTAATGASVTPATTVAPPTDTPADTAKDVISRGLITLDHTRLTVLGDGIISVLDANGAAVGSLTASATVTPILPFDQRARCVLLAESDFGPGVLVDTETGTAIATFGRGTIGGQSGDGCTIAFESSTSTTTRIVGIDVDGTLDATVRGVSPDGAAVFRSDAAGVALVRLDAALAPANTGKPAAVELITSPGVAVFAHS
jgi:hypothetical protein